MTDYKAHECEKLPRHGINIIFHEGSSFRDYPVWQLHILKEATAQDLQESCDYEEVGDTIWQAIVEISHCPYCGENLYEMTHELEVDFGEFALFSGGRWQ
jgi:hypothetical protein